MKDNPYGTQKEKKRSTLFGDFKKSNVFDTNYNKSERVKTETRIPRMHYTSDLFTTQNNSFKTFLNEREELPRLSILDNYKQIMRIMTNSYVNQNENARKYLNVDPKNASADY